MLTSPEHIRRIHEQKVAFMMRDLGERGLQRGEIAPLIYRILWNYGITAVPPLFASLRDLLLVQVTLYGLLFTLVAYPVAYILAAGPFSGISFVLMLSMFIFAGIVFGLPISVYYRIRAKKLKLPSWEEYGNTT